MTRDERQRLHDIREAIVAIRAHLAAVDARTDDERGAMLRDALLFQFMVIGEAVKHLAPETRDAAPEIPWSDVAGLRDLIAHEYFRIDFGRVVDIVDRDLHPIEQAIDRLLGESRS